MRIHIQHPLKRLRSLNPAAQAMQTNCQVIVGENIIRLRCCYGEIAAGRFLKTAQPELKLTAQRIEIGNVFAWRNQDIERLLEQPCGTERQGVLYLVSDHGCGSSGHVRRLLTPNFLEKTSAPIGLPPLGAILHKSRMRRWSTGC